jgi:hypothetical protein
MLVVNAPRAVPSLCVKPPMTDSCMVLCNLAACAGPVPASTECSRCTRRQCNFYSKNDTMEVCGMVQCDGATGANVRTCSIPWPSPDCPLTQGMSAQGMTAIPSLCPLLQGMGSKGWHSSPESEPLRQGMGWGRTTTRQVQHGCNSVMYTTHLYCKSLRWVLITGACGPWLIPSKQEAGEPGPLTLNLNLMTFATTHARLDVVR